jgi:ATP-dependent DNA helicase RecQ
LLFSGADVISMKSMIEKSAAETGAAPEFVTSSLKHLDEMSGYARGAVCRHKALVQHFDQRYEKENCTACDICLGDTTDVSDSLVIAQKILSCVARVKESFGITHVIDVLRGADTVAVRNRGHDQLSTYGLLRDVPKPALRDWVYQLVGQGVLVQAGDEYPVLKLNADSWAVMKGQRTVRLIELARSETVSTAKGPRPLVEGADPELFETLRQLRRGEAAKAGIPPYQIFPDTVLGELARGRPTTEDALRRVSGVGEYKLRTYGQLFLDAINEHCRRTGLTADVPMPRTTAARPTAPTRISPKKEQSFRLFREGAVIAEVVHQTGLSRSTVTDHLADFIRAEKPDSIFGWVSEDVCERVAAAAEKHGTARLKPAFLELNEEVSYDDIRVVFAFLDTRHGG